MPKWWPNDVMIHTSNKSESASLALLVIILRRYQDMQHTSGYSGCVSNTRPLPNDFSAVTRWQNNPEVWIHTLYPSVPYDHIMKSTVFHRKFACSNGWCSIASLLYLSVTCLSNSSVALVWRSCSALCGWCGGAHLFHSDRPRKAAS